MATTIRDFLSSMDPNIESKRTGVKASHTTVAFSKEPRLIRKWRDFDLTTLNRMGDGAFGQALEQPFDIARYPEFTGYRHQRFSAAFEESGLDDYLVKSVQNTVTCALIQTQKYFRRQRILPHTPRPGISMVRGPHAAKIPTEPGYAQCDYKPDWAGCFPAVAVSASSKYSQTAPTTRLPGDTKLRWKVDLDLLNTAAQASATIVFDELGRVKPEKQRRNSSKVDMNSKKSYSNAYQGLRHALIQVYTYCYYANCRYGYIINETQLLVFRIRPNSRARSVTAGADELADAVEHDGLLEYRVISYNRADQQKLSVNIALWWLHLLAAIDCEIRWWYTPLMEMDLSAIRNVTEHVPRQMSEEYEAPPDSQVVESSACDLRPPPPIKREKRKQLSKHESGVRRNPNTTMIYQPLLERDCIRDEPESEPELVSSILPSEKRKDRSIQQCQSPKKSAPNPVTQHAEDHGGDHNKVQTTNATQSLRQTCHDKPRYLPQSLAKLSTHASARRAPRPEPQDTSNDKDLHNVGVQTKPVRPALACEQDIRPTQRPSGHVATQILRAIVPQKQQKQYVSSFTALVNSIGS